MEEKLFVGFQFGQFENDQGVMQDYCSIFVLEDFNGVESNAYHFSGQKAVKYGCVNPSVWKDVQIGQRVRVFFDSRKKVSFMAPCESSK